MAQTVSRSEKAKVSVSVWIGRVLSGLVVAFMLFDTGAKLAGESHVATAMAELGWPAGQTAGIGLTALACTLLYVIPRTSILGAIALTAFFGGATAAKVRIEDASLFFPVFVGVLAWAGLYLREARLRALLPFQREV
ncbi:MAG TPA: DoxX family protein [Polyangiaceae bacterium]|nr:DoxX family protein [Polyangiaceae bacterium]